MCAFHQGGLFGGARIAAAPLDELHDMHKKKEDFTKDHWVSRTAGASSPAGIYARRSWGSSIRLDGKTRSTPDQLCPSLQKAAKLNA